MTPRPVGCDGYDCKPEPAGWTHDQDCLSWQPSDDIGGEDMAVTEARADGYSRAYGVSAVQTAQPKAVAA